MQHERGLQDSSINFFLIIWHAAGIAKIGDQLSEVVPMVRENMSTVGEHHWPK